MLTSPLTLSPDQEEAIAHITRWFDGSPPPVLTERNGRPVTVGQSHDFPVCSVGGYAGTGKTTILRCLGEADAHAVFVTPTHKAAQVLRSKLPPSLRPRVSTFHSLIYSPDPKYTCVTTGQEMTVIDCGCPNPEECDCEPELTPCSYHVKYSGAVDDSLCEPQEHLKFIKREYLSGHHSYIIVDEASMLTELEVNDLRSFGLPVLLVGDHGQLPPVKAKMNPWIENPSTTLTVNHRQGEESGIPDAAYDARTHGVLRARSYGSSVRVIAAQSDTAEALLERFRPDASTSTILVQYNRSRAGLNQMFHEQAYGHGAAVCVGERLISLERQEEAQEIDSTGTVINETMIHNGALATVTRVHSTGPRVITVEAVLDSDWKGRQGVTVLLRLATEQLGSAEGLSYRAKPGGSSLWDYAYALTCHKFQGSEAKNVIVWQETKGDKRWLYSAVTRAKEALVVLV